MNHKMKILLPILMICLCQICLTTAFATNYKSLMFEEIVGKTDIAFQGKVTDIVVELRENQAGVEEPWTKVSFEVQTLLKGNLNETHSLYFYGGTLDGQTVQVEAMPSFRVDEVALVFAYDAVYYSPLVGFSQGLFRLDEQGWQNEAGKWLSIEEDKLELTELELTEGEDANKDSEAVTTILQEIFSQDVEGDNQ